jgi:hypothetical protein
MNIKLLISTVLILQSFIANSESQLSKHQLLSKNDVELQFSPLKVSSTKLKDDSSLIIQDTLGISQGLEAMRLDSIDSLGKKIAIEKIKLLLSNLTLIKESEFELIRYPLNPKTNKMFGETKQPPLNYNLESYVKYLDKKEAERAIKFDSIAISYISHGWFAEYYYDLKLYDDGQFLVNQERVGSDIGELDDNKSILGLFEGDLSQDKLSEINPLLSSSGILKLESKDYGGYVLHGKEICIKLFYNQTYKELKGMQGMFPVNIESIISRLLSINDFENYVQIDRNEIFETSFNK